MRFRISALLSALLAVFGISAETYNVAPKLSDDQQSLTIYQIMVASFRHSPDGAPGYNAMWGPDGHRKNGNLKGVTDALPYIKELGANAIWLTPVFDSSLSDFGGEKLQATGYFANNFFDIDPHFGTKADFKELVDTAHNLGLYVIMDGVFGHHGGITEASPKGNLPLAEYSENDRGDSPGNVRYPESLPYFKEVATYWIDEFGIDGWRLDQAYQMLQNGHNYLLDIREAVEESAAARKARGEKWGTLGYMVAEDWGTTKTINKSTLKQGGMISAFDFDGKERISGKMQNLDSEGLTNGMKDIELTLSSPRTRGYLNDSIAPNLFLTNHDGYRLADHFNPADPHYIEKQMLRFAILAAYNGPVTLYYGDEFADRSIESTGGQPDNIARTTGRLQASTSDEQSLHDYVANAMNIRRNNPAMWRGKPRFTHQNIAGANTLIVDKTDPQTGNRVLIVFSDADTTVPVHGYGAVSVDAYRPEIIVVN